MLLEESAKWRSLNSLSHEAARAVFQADDTIERHRELLDGVRNLAQRIDLPGQYLSQMEQCIGAMIDGCIRGREGARKAHIDAQKMIVAFEAEFHRK